MVGVKLDVWSLFSDKKVLILMPLLFIALLISKLVPALILRKWYDMKTVLASGFLLTSTLLLVIAAATVGENIGVIDSQMSGALILVAIITCIITPIIFRKLFPKLEISDRKLKVNMLGANQFTLPVIREMDLDLYDVTIYHPTQDKIENRYVGFHF